jgi:hypothetical protein
MTTELNMAERNAQLRAFHEDAGGAFVATIITPWHIPSVMSEAARGDPHAMAMRHGMSEWLNTRDALSAGTNHCCLTCGGEFRAGESPGAFAILVPFASVKSALASGICLECVAKTDDLEAAVTSVWRMIWPDLHGVEGGLA